MIGEDLPAWSLDAGEARTASVRSSWPRAADRAWAFGDGRGAGVRVAVVDSGIDPAHPAVGGALARSVTAEVGTDGETMVGDDEPRDLSGWSSRWCGRRSASSSR